MHQRQNLWETGPTTGSAREAPSRLCQLDGALWGGTQARRASVHLQASRAAQAGHRQGSCARDGRSTSMRRGSTGVR